MNTYLATFKTETLKRKSERPYMAAWRVEFVRHGDYNPGTTGVESGFSQSVDLAQKAAASFVSSITVGRTNPKTRGGYRPKPCPAWTIISSEVVLVTVKSGETKAKRTYRAVFADGTVKTVQAAVNYTVAVRVSYLVSPRHGEERQGWTDFLFSEAQAQAKAAESVRRHQTFYQNAPANWGGTPGWDCQLQVEIVPANIVEA